MRVHVGAAYTRDRNGINMEYPRVKRGLVVFRTFCKEFPLFVAFVARDPVSGSTFRKRGTFLMLMARVISSIATKLALFSLDIYTGLRFFSPFLFFFFSFARKTFADKRKELRERVSFSLRSL